MSSTACSRAWWASKPAPTLENLGQIADGLGLNAVLMQLPSAHLGRLSMPAVLELPEAGRARSRNRFSSVGVCV